MPRLAQLTPTISSLAPRIRRDVDAHGHSKTAEAWRRWYKVAAWAEIRRAVFLRDGYRCQMCGLVTPRPIADHIKPHRGDRRRFFDLGNVQTLCKPCHDGPKQAAERRGLA